MRILQKIVAFLKSWCLTDIKPELLCHQEVSVLFDRRFKKGLRQTLNKVSQQYEEKTHKHRY